MEANAQTIPVPNSLSLSISLHLTPRPLSSFASPGFDAWQDSCDEDVDVPMPPVYTSYTFWNLTNYDEVVFEVRSAECVA